MTTSPTTTSPFEFPPVSTSPTSSATPSPVHQHEPCDPFAVQREPGTSPFTMVDVGLDHRRRSDGSDTVLSKRDRRLSKEWDASKTPPSRFQKVEGSIYATPASRDGHIARNKIHGFKEKVRELAGKK